jgi:Insertion element 4 transposase N-terminal/Transposase DDE domain
MTSQAASVHSNRFVDHISLGVLMSVLDRDRIDEILIETGRLERRVRLLPARVVVYYVIALGLFFGDAYEEVMRKLVGGLRQVRAWSDTWKIPTTSALSQARARLGEEPLRMLFEDTCRPIATLSTPGGFYGDWRIMAMDGVVLDAPDTPENNKEFTHTNTGRFPSAYPAVRVLALVEAGTHAVIAASVGTATDHESPLVRGLLHAIEPNMLVTADRGLAGVGVFQALTERGAVPLLRVASHVRLDVIDELPDGSYVSALLTSDQQSPVRKKIKKLGGVNSAAGRAHLKSSGIPCRVITYTVDHPDGGGETIRLITSLLDHDGAPALELAALYHERWEIELVFKELQVYQTGGLRVLRSRSPDLVRQELWGLLIAHYAVRRIMHQATIHNAIDPDRISFTRSLRIVRRAVSTAADFSPSPTASTPQEHPDRDQ